ncbi:MULTISPECIES: iron-siderophore ABC transporter substrate-binding protein [Sinorhizobium]|uniref:Iron-siderophore ABC transporter substrate-binding protein n=1 Tax=Sinorhizobium kummerowiae TaxID=158892 RepID=A0ABY8TGL9_9HYPH|nr:MULTISPECIES: iron-siderophore ABC transporter substrate-binding protein [Sinorhizobium]WHS96313.1 iron-siderophore ABC transporter substrate-binding protein [Sinorhizobium kummerowiae]WQH41738.1 iron-siderophore ABC transporter substrate-binding protein [Sinorhizobium kummerowiae]
MRLFRFAVLAVIALLWAGRHDTMFAAESTSYPITIKHAFGNTIIAQKPERVATVAWANHEVPLALGIVPVGMARANFGDDDGDGILPWVDARLGELKAEKPVLFDEGDGIDFEAVAATRPDVILAAYSGLSQADYDTLSDIAPVIAYPQAPWSTDWRETIRLNSAGLGMAAEGEGLIASIEAEIARTVNGHPELKGKSAMFITHLSSWDLSVVNFYTTNDTRVRFFGDLGLMSPKSVVQASQPGRFSGSVSAEQIDAFDDVDILVTYGDGTLFDALKANALMMHMPAVARESIVMLGNNAVGNAANPTPLSIRWVLKDYVKLLSEAVKKTQ